MGDDTTIHARILPTVSIGTTPRGDNKGNALNEKKVLLAELTNDAQRKNSCDPRKDDFFRKLGDRIVATAGAELVRKKSYHPELPGLPPFIRADPLGDLGEKKEVRLRSTDILSDPHRMEIIHLNRTCTSIDLVAPPLPSAAPTHVRISASDANLTDEEKMHKVRHQVSFAQGATGGGRGQTSFECADLLLALNQSDFRKTNISEKLDEENEPYFAEDDDVLDDSGPEEEQDSFDFHSNSTNRSHNGTLDYLEVRPSLASTQLNELRGPN